MIGSLAARAAFVIGALSLAGGCAGSETRGGPDEAAMEPEAGFLEIEPIAYEIHGEEASLATTSSRARLFYSFHPADDHPEERPLLVLTSGGPGASTAILLGGNTAPTTLDAARTGAAEIAENPATWTRFANLLHLDARGTGLSYGLAEGMEDEAARAAEFSLRNFNSFLDAADLVRATLRFLAAHPTLRGSEVVLVGESYAGIRTSLALRMVHHPKRLAAGESLHVDSALAAEIEAHFTEAGTSAAEQFGRAVLLQPRLSSPQQQAAAGAALELPGSILDTVAAETGVPFVRCEDKQAPCWPFANALDYLAEAGRDIYDVRRPAGDAFERYRRIGARFEEPDLMRAALGLDPAAIPHLAASSRDAAYRLAIVPPPPEPEPLAEKLGALRPYDRYFELELFDLIGEPFAGAEAKIYGIERQHTRHGLAFLEDAKDVRFFVTNAAFDAAIFTPALPAALEMYTDVVASVHNAGTTLSIEYREGAFGAPGGTSREVHVAPYDDAGHSVSLDEPETLSADVAAWLTGAKR